MCGIVGYVGEEQAARSFWKDWQSWSTEVMTLPGSRCAMRRQEISLSSRQKGGSRSCQRDG